MKKHKMRKLALIGIAAVFAGGIVITTGCGKKQPAQPTGGVGEPGGSVPVTTASVRIGTIRSSTAITGSMEALEDATVSAKISAPVVAVNAREGDHVRAGQVLVQLSDEDLQANVRQAQANVETAVTKLSQAQTNYQIGVTQAQQGVIQARAQVAQARENYLKTFRGNRPQEKLQSYASLLQAKANLDNALTTLNRNKSLYAQGAAAKSDLDTAQTNYNDMLQQYSIAQQAYSLEIEGNRQEDIAAALAQLRQNQTLLQNAVANLQTVQLRKQDIIAAQAGIDQTKEALVYAQQQVDYAIIRSPFDGIVAARDTEPGQVATVGGALMRVVNVRTMYYEPTISETDFAHTQPGDRVNVRVDALPGKKYIGKVVAVFPAASTSDRVFSLRVNVDDPQLELRPGMFARGQLITQVAKNVPIVPATALIPASSAQGYVQNTSSDEPIAYGTQLQAQEVVVVSPNNTAQMQPVTVGISNMREAQIVSGLKGGEQIVVIGQQGLQPGDKLAPQTSHSHGGGGSNGGQQTPQS